MPRKYHDEAEVEERANKINVRLKTGKLGPPPSRKIIPCRKCAGQALLEVVDKQWVYVCIACGEEIPLQE